MADYEKFGASIGRLVQEKNAQYGNSHSESSKVLEVLYPQGIPTYAAAITVVRVVDKLFRIANGDMGEESAWRDIAGYALLMANIVDEENAAAENLNSNIEDTFNNEEVRFDHSLKTEPCGEKCMHHKCIELRNKKLPSIFYR